MENKKSSFRIDKNGNKKVMFNFYLEEDLYSKLCKISQKEKYTMATLLNRIAGIYVNCYDKISSKEERTIEKEIKKTINCKEKEEEVKDEEDN